MCCFERVHAARSAFVLDTGDPDLIEPAREIDELRVGLEGIKP